MTDRPRALLIAPLLGHLPGRIPDVFERLGPLLAEDVDVVMTSRKPGRVARALEMVVTVRREAVDVDLVVLHLYSGRAFGVADLVTRAVRRVGSPLVGVVAGGAFPEFTERHPRWVPSVLSRFDRLVTPSSHLGDWAQAQQLPVSVIPNPLDTSEYRFRRREVVSPTMFWMRAYHEIYRPFTAIEVLERVRARHPEARLTMAGPDKGLRSSVAEIVESKGLASAVELLEFVGPAEKAELFERHDIFLNTPAVDNRPVCLVEAAASGLVIVSTDAGGIPALVEHDRNALLAPVDDAAALADRVLDAVADAQRSGERTLAARQMAEEGSPSRVRAQWLDLIADVVA